MNIASRLAPQLSFFSKVDPVTLLKNPSSGERVSINQLNLNHLWLSVPQIGTPLSLKKLLKGGNLVMKEIEKWRLYEAEKQKLLMICTSSEEYEQKIKEIVDKLNL